MLSREKEDFIRFMLSSDVLRFGSFVTKSGRNTPYFINTGNYRTGSQIHTLGAAYAQLVTDTVGDRFDAVFGPAYKGIPLAAACVSALFSNHKTDKPYFFNRKEVKDHGEGGTLVGYQPKDKDRVIIIEDVITAGTAIRETLPILKGAADVSVQDMFISVNRREKGQSSKTATDEIREEFGINVHAIVDVSDIRSYLRESGLFSELLPAMDAYMEQYCVL